ncbi:hypothetical protein VTI28DRAFT_7129 [Corynascus sepedonium]
MLPSLLRYQFSALGGYFSPKNEPTTQPDNQPPKLQRLIQLATDSLNFHSVRRENLELDLCDAHDCR